MNDIMKTFSKTIALAFILLMIVSPAIACVESMGEAPSVDSKNIKVNNFDDMSGGSIEVPITGDSNTDIHVEVKSEDGNTTYASKNVRTGSDGKVVAKLDWNFGSSGDKTVYIYLDGTKADGGLHISVSHSIWKDPLTYVAIVAVIILIAIAVFIKMRGVPGKKDKKHKTFTQIEEEKKSGEKKSFFKKESTQIPAELPKDDTTSTEKQEYTPGKGFFRRKK